jgi:major membrane immunogen (membrane-anchored lipoprotein)
MKTPRFSFVFVLLLAAMLSGCGSSADSTADHFMSLLVAGKHLEAQEMLSKDMRSMATLLGGVSNQSLNPYYRSGQFKSFTLTQTEKTGNAVRYKVRAITKDGQAFDDFLDLIQEDGKWKVARF